ncbi:thiamine pyrophosphate-binding protein, partial [Patescibacteria group bacterium]|nr:thiamine pyrophosphate-binding protein [Patescibacteria group bacterium]
MVNKHYFAPSQVNGNVALIKSLKKMGINFYSGITGGGVAHFLTSLSPYAGFSQKKNSRPSFLTILEYISGFIPIGYYLASGKISASITTTGAAIKLASCGMNDAKLHNIPAVYLVPLNPKNSKGLAPMQDVSSDGMNIIPQLKAELGDGCVVINSIKGMAGQLKRAQKILSESRPVAIAFYPDILTKAEDVKVGIYKIQNFQKTNEKDLNKDLNKFLITAKNKKIVIFVGEEAARSKNIQKLTTQFAELLQAPTVWSINGINAVSHENNYGYGQILFGGNDKSIELWKNIKKDGDYVIIMLGFDPGEFILNFEKIRASYVWHFTNFKKPY